MSKIAIIIHRGTEDNFRIYSQKPKQFRKNYRSRYHLLEHGAKAVDVIEPVIKMLEDDRLFNAGKGSLLSYHDFFSDIQIL